MAAGSRAYFGDFSSALPCYAGAGVVAHPALRRAQDGTGALFAKPPFALARDPRQSSRSQGVRLVSALPGHDPAWRGSPLCGLYTPIPLLCPFSVACGFGGPSGLAVPPILPPP